MKQADLSDFQFHVARCSGVNVLVIIDLNLGGRSVTNNIESILSDAIAPTLGSLIYGFPIIYRDSDGIYDGVRVTGANNDQVDFYSIGVTDEQEAIRIAIKTERSNILIIGSTGSGKSLMCDEAWKLFSKCKYSEGENEKLAIPEQTSGTQPDHRENGG